MSKSAKVLIGILTFLPFVLGIAIIWSAFSMVWCGGFANMPQGEFDDTMRHGIPHFAIHMMLLMLTVVVIHIALLIIYIVHVARSRSASETERLMWILLFIFVGTISFPIYFFLKIVPDHKPTASDMLV